VRGNAGIKSPEPPEVVRPQWSVRPLSQETANCGLSAPVHSLTREAVTEPATAHGRRSDMTIHSGVARRFAPVGLVLIVSLAVVSGCARPGSESRLGGATSTPGPPGTSAAGTYRPDDVVVRVEYVDGFVPVEFRLASMPLVTVYGDGRVITRPRTDSTWPRPALPNILIQIIDAADVATLATRALTAGVGNASDFGQPLVMDAPYAEFTVLTDAGLRKSTVYALGVDDDARELTPAQRAARQALLDLEDDLMDLPSTLGPNAVRTEQPYRAAVIAVLSRPSTESDLSAGVDQPEKTWPGPTRLGGSAKIWGMSCTTITGNGLRAVLDVATSAHESTTWVWNGQRWLARFRPLLPDETSCDDLT